MIDNPLKDKVAVVTGASSGIGQALAFELAGKGASVVIAARRLDKLDLITEKIKNAGGEVSPVRADVSREEDCRELIRSAFEKYGRIDILINNAGISMRALFEQSDLEVIRKLMDTNFWGTVYCTKYALPYLLQSKGSVVGISSIAGYKGLPGRTGYSASKFAIHGFLETLRIENRKKGLHVMIACPGFTSTNIRFTSLNAEGKQQGDSPRDESKMMSPEEVGRHIVKAIVRRKKFVTLTMEGKMTVWLNKFFPSLMDKIVYDHMAKEPDSPFK